MSDPSVTSEQRFTNLIEMLLRAPGVTHGQQKRGFGSNALKIRDSIFAMLANNTLVVKLPRARVDDLVAQGVGEQFDPHHDGRLMKEWLLVDPASDADWPALAREALAFVASTR